MRLFGCAFFFLASLVTPLAVSASAQTAQDAYEELPPLVVKGTPTPISPATEVTSTTAVYRDELSATNESDLDKVLRGLPSVTILEGSRGAGSGLFLRGASAGLGQWLLDGIPLYSATTSVFNLDGFSPGLLERVEIVRGASASRYGSLAQGGVLRLFSRDAGEDGAFLKLEGGSYGTLAETAGASWVGKPGRVTVTARHEDVFEGISAADVANGNRERDGFWANQAALHFVADPLAALSLNGTLIYTRTRADIDGFGVLPSGQRGLVDDESAFADIETWLAQHTASFTLTPAWESFIQLGFTQERGQLFVNNIAATSTARLGLARWQNTHTVSPLDDTHLTLTWGGEGRHEAGEGRSPFASFEGARGQLSGFAEIEADYDPWSGVAGVRVDHYDEVGLHPIFYLGLAVRLVAPLKLRASGGTGFRVPSFNELFFPVLGNPALLPAESASGDVGLDWTPLAGMRLSVTGFYNRFDDLIELSVNPQVGWFTSRNVARARVLGSEVEWVYEAGDGVSGGVEYTYTDSRDLDTGRDLPLLPRHQGRVHGQWELSRIPVTLWAEGIYRGRHFDDPAQTLLIEDSVQVNAQISYRASPHVVLFLLGENLSNDRTPEIFSVGAPGIAVYAGIRLSL